jgi:ribonuclease HII
MPARIDPAQIPATPDLEFESSLWKCGIFLAAGLDEAGRGAWAGPVAAAAVILPVEPGIYVELIGVRDSKELTPEKRDLLVIKIKAKSFAYHVGFGSPEEIDRLGILPATRLAMQRAINGLKCFPEHLLIDALFLPDLAVPQTALIKGDQRSLSIAAASILAKTARDALMREYDQTYPQYGFARHKGYGTKMHIANLEKFGASPIHRMSFAPLKG